MTVFRQKWHVIAVSLLLFAVLAYLIGMEPHFIESGPIKSLDANLLAGLYQVAVASLLEQSTFFSSWSIGLIIAAWYVMVREFEKTPHPVMAIAFVVVCGTALGSLFLGQLLHQVVIQSIAFGQDPLFNPQTSRLVYYQYWVTVSEAIIVSAAVVWKFIND